MTCDHAGCDADATTACRMGDGWVNLPGHRVQQTYVRYCDPHLQEADRLFRLCDVKPLEQLTAGRAGGGMHRRR